MLLLGMARPAVTDTPGPVANVTVCAIRMTDAPDLDFVSGSDYFPLDALIDPAKKAEMLDSFKSTHNALINYKSAEAKQ